MTDEKKQQLQSLTLTIIRNLQEKNNYCEEVHIQTLIFLLKELFHYQLEIDFFFYKDMPHSFDLTDFLIEMKADGLIQTKSFDFPNDPQYYIAKNGETYLSRISYDYEGFVKQLDFLTDVFKNRSRTELDRLSSIFFLLNSNKGIDVQDIISNIRKKRPSITNECVKKDIEEVQRYKMNAEQILVEA
jgi:hypothetical protein